VTVFFVVGCTTRRRMLRVHYEFSTSGSSSYEKTVMNEIGLLIMLASEVRRFMDAEVKCVVLATIRNNAELVQNLTTQNLRYYGHSMRPESGHVKQNIMAALRSRCGHYIFAL